MPGASFVCLSSILHNDPGPQALFTSLFRWGLSRHREVKWLHSWGHATHMQRSWSPHQICLAPESPSFHFTLLTPRVLLSPHSHTESGLLKVMIWMYFPWTTRLYGPDSQNCIHLSRWEAVECNSFIPEAISSRTSRLNSRQRGNFTAFSKRNILGCQHYLTSLMNTSLLRMTRRVSGLGFNFQKGSLHGIIFWGVWRCFRHTLQDWLKGTVRNQSTDAENAKAVTVDRKHSLPTLPFGEE